MNPFEKIASLKKYWDLLKKKLQDYSDTKEARDWLNNNLSRVKALFDNYTLRDFIFEPFKGIFDAPAKEIDKDIYSVITQVAIVNAVMAGLPGKMGVGVYVAMAFEGWVCANLRDYFNNDKREVDDSDMIKVFEESKNWKDLQSEYKRHKSNFAKGLEDQNVEMPKDRDLRNARITIYEKHKIAIQGVVSGSTY